MIKVFIDGSSGTTGLQINERLASRKDIELLKIDFEKRHDPAERAKIMNESDIVFLCLPDAAAIEAATLVTNPKTGIIDASTAHRCAPDWTYGFPEIGLREKIRESKRTANPGCHASGFIAAAYPLIEKGIVSKEALLTCFSLTGYSGGGKTMIADYESEEKANALYSPSVYALGQTHKHVPEIKKICGLSQQPVFCPVVDDFLRGMATTVMIGKSMMEKKLTVAELTDLYKEFYEGEKVITVRDAENAPTKVYANEKTGTDGLEIVIAGNGDAITVTSLFDNLGKGASGAAIQNMNIMLGRDELTGLVL